MIMASIRSVLALVVTFMACQCSLAFAVTTSQPELPTSTISAAPALLPNPPLSAPPPALSPDITPLFPSPGGSELSPSDSSMPTIPSSPSPPNPDAMVAPGPGIAFSPFGSLPDSHSAHLHVSGCLSSTLALALLSSWLIRLYDM